MKDGLSKEDALCRARWMHGINQITARLRLIRQPSLVGIIPDLRCWFLSRNGKLL